MTTINVPVDLLTTALAFTDVGSQLTKRAFDEVEVHRAAQKQAADLVEPLLDHMVKSAVIAPTQREAARAMLGGHATTLQLLKAAVDKVVDREKAAAAAGKTKTAGDLGRGEGDAGGGSSDYNSLTHPVVGVKTANVKESDKSLMRLAGLAVHG